MTITTRTARKTAALVVSATTMLTLVAGCSNREKNAAKGEPAARSASGTPQAITSANLSQKPPNAVQLPATLATPPANATETILAKVSPDCLICARAIRPETGCDIATTQCEKLTDPKMQAQCLDTLRCVLPGPGASCVSTATASLTSCYCGGASVEECLKKGVASGVCKQVIETGFKTTDPVVIARSLVDTSYSSGVAMNLTKCLAKFGLLADPKCRSCF
jgi:hypothetical protein